MYWNNHLTQASFMGRSKVHYCTDLRRFVFLFMLLLLQTLVTNVFAGERTKEEMRMAALNALSNSNKARGKTVTARTSDLKEYVAMEKLSVIGNEDLGFAVVTSDDRFDDVIGYSVSEFSKEMPCGFKWWLETAEDVMENTQGQTATTRSKARSKTAKASVEPLMTTKWYQDNPYNASLNCTIGGKSYIFEYTGCVATAMAQVIKYHRFPKKSIGEIYYYIEAYDILMRHEFGETYDYDNMLDEYNDQQYGNSDKNVKAVATLMKDCGMAVKMQYKKGGSGASPDEIPVALKTYFSYSQDTKLFERVDYTNKTEWMQMIYNELSDGRPIIYGGMSSSTSGHAFVLHGYDSSGLVYVNWGWSGRYDGYFDIDILKPQTNNYRRNQIMVFAIPNKDQAIVNKYNLSINTDGNGSVSYNDNTIRNNTRKYSIDEGSSVTLTITPDYGYKIKSVTVNDINVTSQVYNNRYTISSISKNTTVYVAFEALPVTTYGLTISASGNGSISYSGSSIRNNSSTFTINEGSSATLTIASDNGYQIKSVTVNDIDVTSQVYNNRYTINNITKNTTVNVVFEALPIATYSLTISSSANGSVSYSGNSIRNNSSTFNLDEGSSATITITPDVGYQINSVIINNINVTSQVYNNRYTISNITQNTTVNVVFEATRYALTISASGNGSVSYNGSSIKNNSSTFNLDENSSATFTIMPDNDYQIKSLTVNDIDVTSQITNNSYTISSITKNTIVNVVFEAPNCSLMISASGGGSVLYLGNSIRETVSSYSIDVGSSAILTITPDNGYKLRSITVNDIDVTSQVSGNIYTLSNIALNTTVSILFGSASFNPSDYNKSFGKFEVDGIMYYNPYGKDEVTVVSKSEGYSGRITIPSTVTYQGLPFRVTRIGSAFSNCSGLLEVNMPDEIIEISSDAFSDCTNLQSINFSGNLKKVGSSAFKNCSSLTSISLPQSVTSIDYSAFQGCSNLSSVTLPNDISTISQNLFYNCSNLESITIPEGVTSIELFAFYGCSNLKSVIIPEGVISIGEYAFGECNNLRDIVLPTGVTSIGSFVFSGCNLHSVIIPANVKDIGAFAFNNLYGTDNLTDVFCLAQIPPTLTNSNSISNKATIYVYQQALNSYASADYWKDYNVVGLSVEDLDDFIKNGYYDGINRYLCCGITSISKSTSSSYVRNQYTMYVTNNHSDAIIITRFIAKDPLTGDILGMCEDENLLGELNGGMTKEFTVTITKDIEPVYEIYYSYNGKRCLLNTDAEDNGSVDLTIQSLENGYISWNEKLEDYADKTRSIILRVDKGSSCTLYIHPYKGYRIKTVTLNGTDVTSQVSDNKYVISSLNSNTVVVAEYETNPYSPSVKFELAGISYESWDGKDEVYVIKKEEGYSGIINIPETVIYNNLPYRVTHIDSYAFSNCTDLQEVSMPDNVVVIGDCAFEKCTELQEVSMSDNVVEIGYSAFKDCSNLQNVTMSKNLITIGGSAFENCSSITSISLPHSVTSIGSSAFARCSKLRCITLPNGISTIANNLFINCSDLQDITIPTGITSIGFDAFTGCNLHTIIIPDHVETIGNGAFGLNYNLKVVGCLSITPPSIDSYFPNEDVTIYVYSQAVDSYKSADYWKKHKIVGLSKENMDDFCMNGYSDGINDYLSCGITSIASAGYTIGSTSYIQKAFGLFLTNNYNDAITITKVVAKDPSTNSILASLKDESILSELKGGETKEFSITINKDVDPEFEIYYSYNGKPCLLNSNATDIRRYDMTIESKGDGIVTCNDQTAQNSSITLKQDRGSRCTLVIIPDQGYRIKSVTLNGTDITSQVSDFILVINRIASNNSVSVEFEKNIISGDVNGDYSVDVFDVVSMINFIMGKPSEVFNEALADMNEDKEVDIFDVMQAIIVALNNKKEYEYMDGASRSNEEQAFITATSDGVILGVNDPSRFTAFQFDVEVSDGMDLTEVRLTANRTNHKLRFIKTGQNIYRVMGVSMDNSQLSANGNDLLELSFSKGGSVWFSDIVFVTPQESKVCFASGEAIVTGIGGIGYEQQAEEIFDLSGRKVDADRSCLPKGIYIINNKKVVIK